MGYSKDKIACTIMAAVYTDISSVSVQFALIRDVSAQALFLDKILSHF